MIPHAERLKVRRYADQALTRAGVWGLFPTPINKVLLSSGVADILDVSSIPPDLRGAMPEALQGKLLGATLLKERTVYVDTSLSAARNRWVKGHEAGHALLPWHQALGYFDDETRISGRCEEILEEEADEFAGYLTFQGATSAARMSRERQASLTAARELSDHTGASFHASARFLVAHHPHPSALIVAGRHIWSNGYVPVWSIEESESWASLSGPATRLLPAHGHLPVTTRPEGYERLAELASTARRGQDAAASFSAKGVDGIRRDLKVEAHFNHYCIFLLFSMAPSTACTVPSITRARTA